jgi:hypothetical protein
MAMPFFCPPTRKTQKTSATTRKLGHYKERREEVGKKEEAGKKEQETIQGWSWRRERQQQTWLQDGAAVAQWAATRIPKRAPASAPASERTQAAAVVAATAMVFPNSLKPVAAAGSILLMARALLLASPAATAAAAFATTCCSSIFVVIHRSALDIRPTAAAFTVSLTEPNY